MNDFAFPLLSIGIASLLFTSVRTGSMSAYTQVLVHPSAWTYSIERLSRWVLISFGLSFSTAGCLLYITSLEVSGIVLLTIAATLALLTERTGTVGGAVDGVSTELNRFKTLGIVSKAQVDKLSSAIEQARDGKPIDADVVTPVYCGMCTAGLTGTFLFMWLVNMELGGTSNISLVLFLLLCVLPVSILVLGSPRPPIELPEDTA